jgi:hypothetical protein
MGAVHHALSRRPLSSGAHSDTIDLFPTVITTSGTLVFLMISSGGPGKTKLLSNHIFKGRIKKYTAIKWVSALPPVIRCSFQRDRPLTHSNSNVGYVHFLMISSGGTRKTKFPSIIFLRGESEKKLDNQIGLQRRPRSYSAHSGAIDPFPKVSPTPGTLVCL